MGESRVTEADVRVFLRAVEAAMQAEGASDVLVDRVLHRLVWGEPKDAIDPNETVDLPEVVIDPYMP